MIDGECLNDWKSPAFGPVADGIVAVGVVDTPVVLSSVDDILRVRGGECFGGMNAIGGEWDVRGGVMEKAGSLPSEESGSSTRPGGRDGTGTVGEAGGSRDDNWSRTASLISATANGGDAERKPRAARSRSTAW